MDTMRVAVGQIPNRVGDLDGNVERIIAAMAWAEAEAADVLVLPELALTGYPLGDLVLHPEFVADALDARDEVARHSGSTTTVLSTVDRIPPQRSWDTRERNVAICATLLSDGETRGCYHKILLPTYDVFDEARNFAPGVHPDKVWRIGDVVAGVAICEDLWSPDGPPEAQSAAGAQILLAPNASPFHRRKAEGRLANARALAVRNGIPIVYVNLAGGQDELVFDGGSIVVDADGRLLHRGREFAEDRFVVDVPVAAPRALRGPLGNVHTRPLLRAGPATAPSPRPAMDETAAVWHALVTAVRDHTDRNGFPGVALGLSGGIDAAVTAAIAAEAVGPDRVLALAMPAPHTPADELADAEKLAGHLGISLEVLPIDVPVADADVPAEAEDGAPPVSDSAATRERRYARARAATLMDIYAERHYLVLVTANKTEVAIGKATILGSLTGGFGPLRDCPKTLVYALGRYRNRHEQALPQRLFDKPTTAQLTAPRTLPPYEVLDAIVEGYIEHAASFEDLCEAGIDPDVVVDVLRRIDDAEFLRRYTPPGVKLTPRGFAQDRRMPLSNHWRPHRRDDRARGVR